MLNSLRETYYLVRRNFFRVKGLVQVILRSIYLGHTFRLVRSRISFNVIPIWNLRKQSRIGINPMVGDVKSSGVSQIFWSNLTCGILGQVYCQSLESVLVLTTSWKDNLFKMSSRIIHLFFIVKVVTCFFVVRVAYTLTLQIVLLINFYKLSCL